ncbi:MAG TPA: 4Fe-4S dicluster domain-containing protein, partial [Clostridiales bacterium]|nr:4Fe-4S dicluster domain-containing protein [Clostridiales bacterium]
MSVFNFSKANCQNCYKCLRTCPVKAIKIKDEQAEIVEERCIDCGQCLIVCPQHAREIKSDLAEVKEAIAEQKRV